MYKILFVMLLTLTSMTYAGDEGRFTMLPETSPSGTVLGVFVLDTENGKVKYCEKISPSGEDSRVKCTVWEDISRQ